MRPLFTVSAFAAVLIAGPAFAQDRARPAPTLDQAAAALSNPALQDAAADFVDQLAAAFLETRVGPLATLTDPRDGVRAGDTLGDVVRRADPAFGARLHARTRDSLATAGQAARGAQAMDRELKAAAARLRAVLGAFDRR